MHITGIWGAAGHAAHGAEFQKPWFSFEGGQRLSSAVELVDEPTEQVNGRSASGGVDSLTPRQREVLALIGQGLSTAEIARRLFRTVKTVESHRLMLGKRLGARNRVELARIAIQAGLIDLDSPNNAPRGFSGEGISETDCDDSPSDSARKILGLIDAGASAETGREFLQALVAQLVSVLGAAAAVIVRAAADGDAGSVVGWSERGELPVITYSLAGAEDDGMAAGDVRVIEGPPATMLARVTDMSVLQAGSSVLAALHDSQGQRLGTLLLLLKAMPEGNRTCVQVLRMLAGRVAAELQRLESDNRFHHLRSLLASSTDRIGMWERNLRNDHVTWSSEIYRILGFDPNEMPATRERFLSLVHPEDRSRVVEAYDEAVKRCAPTAVKYRVVRDDGSERHVEACYEASLDITGRPGWVLGTIRDVTAE